MARSFLNVFAATFSSVVVLYLTLVAFPNFIASQNVKLRTIFNSSVASFKFNSREQLVSNKTEVGNSLNESILQSENEGKTEIFPGSFLRNTALNSLQTEEKLERSKRQISSHEVAKEVFAWNFNLNVSRIGRATSNEAAKKDSKTSQSKELEVAVYVENQGSQETAFNELQRVLGIVGGFMKNIFSSGSENGTNDSKGMNEMEIKQLAIESLGERSDLSTSQNFNIRGPTEKDVKEFSKIVPALEEQSPSSILETSQNPDTQNFEDQANKGRKGRIFLRNFSFSRLKDKLLGITTPVSETEETESFMDNTGMEGNIFRQNESLPDHPRSELVTENSQHTSSFRSNSLLSESENSTKHVFDNMEKFDLQPSSQQHECHDCLTESFGLSDFSSKENEVSVNIVLETTKAQTVFSNEILEKYCRSLLSTLEESQPSLREESTKTRSEMIEDSLVIKTDESTTESSIFTDKPRRFFGMFDSGSGRSEIMPDENDLLSDRQTGEFGDLPSDLDCEEFFSKKQNRKIFPTLNSLDVNDLQTKIFPNFGNPTLSPKLEEHQLQFSTNLSSSFQTSDTTSESEKIDSLDSGTSIGNESNFTVNKDLFINENGEITTEFSDLGLSNALRTSESTDADSELQITDDQRDGRFFNFFNFGSGSDVQENRNASESRLFLSGFIGSGANSLGTSGDVDESENVALGSEESFHEIEDFSGDGRMIDVSNGDTLEDFNSTSDPKHRFFNFFGFAGSGSGRELIDSTELSITALDGHLPYTGSENIFTEAPLSSQRLKGLNDEYEDDCSDCDHEENFHYEKVTSETTIVLETSKPNEYEDDCSDCDHEDNLQYEKVTSETNVAWETPKPNEYEVDCSDCDHEDNLHYENVTSEKTVLETSKPNDEYEDDCSDCDHEDNLHYEKVTSEINVVLETPKPNDEYEDDCSDCDHEDNLHYEKLLPETTLLETSKLNDSFNSHTTITDLEHESPIISFHLDGVTGTNYDDYATQNIDPLNVTENSNPIQTTEIKPRRFVGILFLTGSGDGGLFADDGGPINLVEEGSTISPVVFSRRKGRLDDPSFNPCDDCGDLSDMLGNSLETAGSNQTVDHLSSPTINIEDNRTVSPMNRHKSEDTTVKRGLTETEDITLSSVKLSSPFPNSTQIELQPRPCIAARDCNNALGERCVTINSSSVCDCGRTFVRQRETRKCVAKGYIETTLKFPSEIFDSELEDRESPRYKLTSKKAIDTTWLLLKESPDIFRIVADVNVAKFTTGSLIIRLELVLAVENEAEAETIKDMASKLQKALGDEKLMKKASLNIRNATVLSLTSELDPCKSNELNYCSKNALCVRNENLPGRHTCFCKEHYLDVSSDPLFPGETCIDKCPPFYCGPHGHCEILENKERSCLCSGLHFGERCEVPGVVVIGSLSIAAFITLAVLIVVIIKIRYNKRSYGRTPTFRRSEEIGPHAIANARVSDVIALGEMPEMKISKFSNISTPMQSLPVIKVTHPTLNESSISFDFDSTFDVTPASAQEQTSVTGNSTI